MITNKVLTQNDGKVILHQKRRFGTRFREKVITNQVLTQNVAKRILYQKGRFGMRIRERVLSKPVFAEKMMQNTFCSENVVLAPDLEKK